MTDVYFLKTDRWPPVAMVYPIATNCCVTLTTKPLIKTNIG